MFDKIIFFLASFIVGGISLLGYSGVVIMMAIESACVPLPSEIIMPFAGYLAAKGEFTFIGVAIAGSIGSVIGSVLAYGVGIYGGRAFIEKYGKYILLSRHDLNLADKFFHKYGSSAMFFSRMLPVVRTFISLPAGIAKMNFTKFIIYTFLGSLPWCFGLAYAGKKLGDHWNALGVYFHKFDAIIGILLILGVAWFIKRHFKNNKNL
ncbi:alkaline phosphatase [Candidatus Falkowbacteria bacterium CG_4_10_14_0_2_um_filter_36_22]|uniref:Alkaline phosphatase n=2 Tax=Candidatus Falkowiibacteriota TaxID=1752728 RepID=A0A1J4T709_9BACT|nr:MAG: alkaline phosphatase [Candidatus Falkowbacteria bacterium CG1_02_37_44]PJA11232.1 MAG: alkaline phosphatase [Candidatus Falkowbacteria bacterium CG_4_10_14_0_2_um_filter_36_22]